MRVEVPFIRRRQEAVHVELTPRDFRILVRGRSVEVIGRREGHPVLVRISMGGIEAVRLTGILAEAHRLDAVDE